VAAIPEAQFKEALAGGTPRAIKNLLSKQRRKETHERIRVAATNARTAVGGPYALIYADPPWHFETISENGIRTQPPLPADV
jgi:hypothetical protein